MHTPCFRSFFFEENNADVLQYANREEFLWVKLLFQTAATSNDIDSFIRSKPRTSLAEIYGEKRNRIMKLDDPNVKHVTTACLINLAQLNNNSIVGKLVRV